MHVPGPPTESLSDALFAARHDEHWGWALVNGRNRVWTVAQMGAREGYRVAVGFQRDGRLQRLLTDAWLPPAVAQRLAHAGPLSGLAHHTSRDLHPPLVQSSTARTLARELIERTVRRPRQLTVRDSYERMLALGADFGKWSAEVFAAHRPVSDRDAVFAYNTGAFELLREAAARGVPSIVDQVDPAQADEAAIREEMERWPGWAQHEGRIPSAYWDRLGAEWQCATAVLVNSQWSKLAIVAAGVPVSRVIVVPLAYEPETPDALRLDEVGSGADLRVLWLGQVNLRKGFPYFVEAARLVRDERIQFTVAGPVRISARALQTLPSNIRVDGHVSRARALALYRTSDILVLPTLSDGFALTQLEAMSYGLPVVATDRCGDVVEDGRNGFRVRVRDSEAVAAALTRLASDRDELRRMSLAAVSRAAEFTLDRYIRSVDEGLATVCRAMAP